MQQRQPKTQHSLRQWLHGTSASELVVVAQLWGVSLDELPNNNRAAALADVLLTPATVNAMLASLSPPEWAALERVLSEGGHLPAPILEREFGTIRPHDTYVNPRGYLASLQSAPSAVERLFLLGLVQLDQHGPRRTYVVPTDLRPLLPEVPPRDHSLHLPAAPEPSLVVRAKHWELEHNIGTLLAAAQAGELQMATGRGINKASLVRLAKRWGMTRDDLRGLTYEQHWHYVHFLRLVLQGADLLRITANNELRPTAAVVEWLQAPRPERLRRLIEGWVASEWDELKRFLYMEIKGYAFGRSLPATHQAILDILANTPPNTWITWDSLLDEVLRVRPDFARPDGDYDIWRLVDYRGQNLDGFTHWREVEGQLLMSTIGGSLRWLGLTDYGGIPTDDDESTPTAFRLNEHGAALLAGGSPPATPAYEPIVVQGTFEVVAPPHTAPYARFQLGRIAKRASGDNPDEAEVYKLTKASVQAAADDQISAEAITDFLEQASGTALPQNVAYSLHEWSGQYGQLTLRQAAVLQTDDPLLLERLRRDRQVRLPPIEELDAQTWLLSEGDGVKLAAALRKAGYGLSGDIEPDGAGLKERDLTMLATALIFYLEACTTLGIESDISGAMYQRIARMLNARQRDTAYRVAHEALAVLRASLPDR